MTVVYFVPQVRHVVRSKGYGALELVHLPEVCWIRSQYSVDTIALQS